MLLRLSCAPWTDPNFLANTAYFPVRHLIIPKGSADCANNARTSTFWCRGTSITLVAVCTLIAEIKPSCCYLAHGTRDAQLDCEVNGHEGENLPHTRNNRFHSSNRFAIGVFRGILSSSLSGVCVWIASLRLPSLCSQVRANTALLCVRPAPLLAASAWRGTRAWRARMARASLQPRLILPGM